MQFHFSTDSFPWCLTEPQQIGIGSLTARILCTTHNNALSDLDEAAGEAFKTLQRAADLDAKRSASPGKRFERVRYGIDGVLLERWFMKTALNFGAMHKGDDKWAIDGNLLSRPGVALVSRSFGSAQFTGESGLYLVGTVGENLLVGSSFEAGPLYRFDEGVIGFIFTFRGFRFLLWLADEAPPLELDIPWGLGEKGVIRSLRRRVGYLRFTRNKKISHYVHFSWPDQIVPGWIYSK